MARVVAAEAATAAEEAEEHARKLLSEPIGELAPKGELGRDHFHDARLDIVNSFPFILLNVISYIVVIECCLLSNKLFLFDSIVIFAEIFLFIRLILVEALDEVREVDSPLQPLHNHESYQRYHGHETSCLRGGHRECRDLPRSLLKSVVHLQINSNVGICGASAVRDLRDNAVVDPGFNVGCLHRGPEELVVVESHSVLAEQHVVILAHVVLRVVVVWLEEGLNWIICEVIVFKIGVLQDYVEF